MIVWTVPFSADSWIATTTDIQERIASGKLFHAEVAAAENDPSPMVAWLVREITSAAQWSTDTVVAGVYPRQKLAAAASITIPVLNYEDFALSVIIYWPVDIKQSAEDWYDTVVMTVISWYIV